MKLLHHIWCFLFLVLGFCVAQTSTIRGTVTDESGAIVPAAEVTLNSLAGASQTVADASGAYLFSNLAPGSYTLEASAATVGADAACLAHGTARNADVNLRLKIASTRQEVVVEENAGPTVSTDAANNASAMVLKGEDLDALSDNPDDLQARPAGIGGSVGGSQRRVNLYRRFQRRGDSA